MSERSVCRVCRKPLASIADGAEWSARVDAGEAEDIMGHLCWVQQAGVHCDDAGDEIDDVEEYLIRRSEAAEAACQRLRALVERVVDRLRFESQSPGGLAEHLLMQSRQIMIGIEGEVES